MRLPHRIRQWQKQHVLRHRIASTLYRSRIAPWKHRLARWSAWLLGPWQGVESFAWREQTTEAQLALLGVHAWTQIPGTTWRDLPMIVETYVAW